MGEKEPDAAPNHTPVTAPAIDSPPEQETDSKPGTLAPVWHTVVLLVGIVALSIHGSSQLSGVRGVPNRLAIYGMTAVLEMAMLGWVAFGLRLRKIPLRSLFGSVSGGMRTVAVDVGVALVFWLGSLMILGTLGAAWSGVEAAVTHQQTGIHAGKPVAPSLSQQEALRTLVKLAPASGKEVAGWVMLCLLVGLAEEVVFRGYLQQQFTAWAHGGVAIGVVFSALAFGAAHGYEGVRNMVMLAVFGALFSLLSLYRRGLRSCIFAHSWHDLVAGLTLAVLRSHHLL